MILKEALIGGTVYLDWIDEENALPETERVAFDYGPIPNRVRVEMLHRTSNANGIPNGADVCKAAIDDAGKKVRNLKAADGTELDSIAKILAYPDKDIALAYMVELVGMQIWRRQAGEEKTIKN